MMKKILFIILILFLAVPCSAYQYAYIEISNNPEIENYQTYTTIDHRDGMNADFSNIRIYDAAGFEVPYYLESYTEGVSAKVWYHIDSDDTKMQVRWGIEGETASESNPQLVYDFYDGFTTLSSSNWDNVTSAGSISVSNGIITINGASSATLGINGIRSRSPVAAVGTITEFRIKRTASASNWAWKNAGISNSGLTSSYLCADNASMFTNNEVGSVKFVSRATTTDQSTTITDTTAWVLESFANTGSSAIYSRNGAVIATHSTYYPTVACYIQAGAGNNAKAGALQIDYVLIRKYASVEPTTTMGDTKNPDYESEWISVYQNENVQFIFDGSSPIVWTVDGVINSETGAVLNISFSTAGNHYITATDSEHTQNSTVTVKRAVASTPIDKLDTADYNNLISNIENENFSNIGSTVTNPYTNVMGRGFFLILFVLPFVHIWKSQGHMSIPTILALIFGGVFIGFVPGQYTEFIIIAIILAFAVALYNLVRDRT